MLRRNIISVGEIENCLDIEDIADIYLHRIEVCSMILNEVLHHLIDGNDILAREVSAYLSICVIRQCLDASHSSVVELRDFKLVINVECEVRFVFTTPTVFLFQTARA